MIEKKYIVFWVVLMTLAGCSKEIESSRINFPEKTVTLTLHGVETKTSLQSDGSVIWSIYDQICVNGQFYPLSVDEDDPSVAYVKGVRESDDYYASYSTVADMTPYHKEGSVAVYIPTQQQYREGGFADYSNPMVSYSETTELHFQHTAGILRVPITGNGIKIRKLSLIANSLDVFPAGIQYVSNESIKNGSPDTEMISKEKGASLTVDINLGEGVILGQEPQYFDFVVQPGTYPEILLQVFDFEDNVTNVITGRPLTISRAAIKEMEAFSWDPEPPLQIEILNPDSITDKLVFKAQTGPTIINYRIVPKAFWDYRATLYPDIKDQIMYFGNNWSIWGVYKGYDITVDYYHKQNAIFPLMPDTEYTLMACHGSATGDVCYGKPAVLHFKTLPSPITPTIEPIYTVSEPVSYGHYLLWVDIKAIEGTVRDVEFYCEPSVNFENCLAQGFTYDEILTSLSFSYKSVLTKEQMFSENGYRHYIDGNASQQYTLLIRFTGPDGMQKIESVEVSAPAGLLPENYSWEEFSSTASFYNTLFADYGVSPYLIENIIVEKAKEEAVFRIKNMFKTDKVLLEKGYVSDNTMDHYIYIDARELENVVIPVPSFNTGLYFPSNIYSGAQFWVATSFIWNRSLTYLGGGVYDKEAGCIKFEDSLIAGHANNGSHTAGSVLYLNSK